MSAQPRSITVQADWQNHPATLELPAAAPAISTLYGELACVFPQLPPPFNAHGATFRLTYLDIDGDEVELESDADLAQAMTEAAGKKPQVLQLFVREPNLSAQSSILSGDQWESVAPSAVDDAGSSPDPVSSPEEEKAGKPAAVAAAAPAASAAPASISATTAPVATAAVVQPAVESHKAEDASASGSSTVSSVVNAVADAPAASPAAASTPSKGWFEWLAGGKSEAAASAAAPVRAAPVADSAALSSPPAPAVPVASRAVSQQSADSSAASSQASLLSDSLIDEGMLVQADLHRSVSDQQQATRIVLRDAFNAMLQRAAAAAGVDEPKDSRANSWVAPPSAALLDALHELTAEQLAPVIERFAEVCQQHVTAQSDIREREERAAALQAAEDERLAAEQRAREAVEAEKAFEAATAKARAEEAAAKAEAEKQAAVAAEQAAVALAQAEAAAAEARKAQAAAAQAAIDAQRAQAIQQQCAAPMTPLAMQVLRDIQNAQSAEASAPAVAVPAQREEKDDEDAFVPRLPDEPCMRGLRAEPVVLQPMPVHIPVAAPVEPAALSASQQFDAAVNELVSMGFPDKSLNSHFLVQSGGKITPNVIEWLMTDLETGGSVKAQLAAGNNL